MYIRTYIHTSMHTYILGIYTRQIFKPFSKYIFLKKSSKRLLHKF